MSVVSREGAEVVSVYDDAGSLVTGATVYMDITYPESVDSVSAVTNDNGIGTYPINRPAKGTYTVTVTNVTHGTLHACKKNPRMDAHNNI